MMISFVIKINNYKINKCYADRSISDNFINTITILVPTDAVVMLVIQ